MTGTTGPRRKKGALVSPDVTCVIRGDTGLEHSSLDSLQATLSPTSAAPLGPLLHLCQSAKWSICDHHIIFPDNFRACTLYPGKISEVFTTRPESLSLKCSQCSPKLSPFHAAHFPPKSTPFPLPSPHFLFSQFSLKRGRRKKDRYHQGVGGAGQCPAPHRCPESGGQLSLTPLC